MFRYASTLASKSRPANYRIRPFQTRLNGADYSGGKRKRNFYVPNSIGNDGGASFLEEFSGCYPGYASVMEKALITESTKAGGDLVRAYIKGPWASPEVFDIANGISKGVVEAHKYLISRLQTLSSCEEILQVAKKLTHGDEKISDIVAKAIEKDGNVIPVHEPGGALGHPLHIKRVKQWLEIHNVTEDDFMRAEAIRAVKVVKVAKSGGSIRLLPGGVAELVHASKVLNELRTKSSMEKLGIQLVQNALKMPMFIVASIAGFEGSTIIQKLLEQDNHDHDFDFFSGEFITRYEPESMILFFTLHDELCYLQRMAEGAQPFKLDDLRIPQLHFLNSTS